MREKKNKTNEKTFAYQNKTVSDKNNIAAKRVKNKNGEQWIYKYHVHFSLFSFNCFEVNRPITVSIMTKSHEKSYRFQRRRHKFQRRTKSDGKENVLIESNILRRARWNETKTNELSTDENDCPNLKLTHDIIGYSL